MSANVNHFFFSEKYASAFHDQASGPGALKISKPPIFFFKELIQMTLHVHIEETLCKMLSDYNYKKSVL